MGRSRRRTAAPAEAAPPARQTITFQASLGMPSAVQRTATTPGDATLPLRVLRPVLPERPHVPWQIRDPRPEDLGAPEITVDDFETRAQYDEALRAHSAEVRKTTAAQREWDRQRAAYDRELEAWEADLRVAGGQTMEFAGLLAIATVLAGVRCEVTIRPLDENFLPGFTPFALLPPAVGAG